MPNGTLIYASRYGSTQEYARQIAGALGFSIVRAQEVGSEHFQGRSESKPVILGSPIYGSSVLPEMVDLLERRASDLVNRIVGAFVVCGDYLWIQKAGEGGSHNLEKLTSLLPEKPAALAVFGGRLMMDELNEEDRIRVLAFYERMGKEPLGFDRMDLSAVTLFVELIRDQLPVPSLCCKNTTLSS